jgi:hypothetical protein
VRAPWRKTAWPPRRSLTEHRDDVPFAVVLAQDDGDGADLTAPSTDRLQRHHVRRREPAVAEGDPETAEHAPTPVGAAVGVEEAIATAVGVRAVVQGVGKGRRPECEDHGASESHTRDCPTHSSLPSLRVERRDWTSSNGLGPPDQVVSKPANGDVSDSHHHTLVSIRDRME